jgi:hypothetical protein
MSCSASNTTPCPPGERKNRQIGADDGLKKAEITEIILKINDLRDFVLACPGTRDLPKCQRTKRVSAPLIQQYHILMGMQQQLFILRRRDFSRRGAESVEVEMGTLTVMEAVVRKQKQMKAETQDGTLTGLTGWTGLEKTAEG